MDPSDIIQSLNRRFGWRSTSYKFYPPVVNRPAQCRSGLVYRRIKKNVSKNFTINNLLYYYQVGLLMDGVVRYWVDEGGLVKHYCDHYQDFVTKSSHYFTLSIDVPHYEDILQRIKNIEAEVEQSTPQYDLFTNNGEHLATRALFGYPYSHQKYNPVSKMKQRSSSWWCLPLLGIVAHWGLHGLYR